MIPSAVPPMPAPEAAPSPMGSMKEVCIPSAMLSLDGEDQKQVSPQPGDPVEFTATGTVSRVDGDNAYVTVETVNGDPLPAETAPAGGPGEGDLLAMASKADEEPTDY